MKSIRMSLILFLSLFSFAPVFAAPSMDTDSFTESETRLLRSILSRIAPIKKADQIFCSFSDPSDVPSKNPIVFCEVQYTDPSRWLAKFRTKWIGGSALHTLLLDRGTCGFRKGWRNPPTTASAYTCALNNVSCEPAGCSAD